MQTSAILVQKTPNFSKFIVCPHEQDMLSQCGHSSDKGDQVFAILSLDAQTRASAEDFPGGPTKKKTEN